MRDLSLHILDLIENSIRARASIISVSIIISHKDDVLNITVEDNGKGLSVEPEEALDPFYTTKTGKITGLGLSLFRATAERAGGYLTMRMPDKGGLIIDATMKLSHIDLTPLGDIAATMSSVMCTNPYLDLRCRLAVDDKELEINVSDITEKFPQTNCCGLQVARKVSGLVHDALDALSIQTY